MSSEPRNPLPLIIRLVGGRRLLFLINCLLWGAVHAAPVLTGLVIKGLFDALAGGAGAGANVWSLIALAILIDVGRLATMGGGIYAFATLWIETTLLLRRNILDYLLTAPRARRLPDSTGEAVSRFRDDVEDIIEYLESWTDFWGFAAYALIALAVMTAVNPILTALVCVPLLLAFALTSLLRPQIRLVRRRMREATGRVTDFIGEMAGGVLALKIAGAEGSALSRFERLNAVRRKAALRDTLITEMFRSVTDNMVHIATGVILLLAAGALRDGSFTVGDFALFVSYLPRLTGIMSFLGNMLVQHKRTGVAFERLERLMQDGTGEQVVANVRLPLAGPLPRFRERRAEREPLERLEVEDLTFTHPDGTPGIHGVSFELTRGSFTVITGEVGSGKSTLLRALLGLVPVAGGTIRWNGRPVEDPASFFVPPVSAYTPQVPRLFSDSLRENLVLGGELPDDELAEALELAVLSEDVARLERGLDTPVGSRGVKLSGGQVQRAAAARMFLRGAQLLVFDDLSSALDVETERRLWQRLEDRSDVTCLVVSHRPAALLRAHELLVLSAGRLVAHGDPAEVLREHGRLLPPGILTGMQGRGAGRPAYTATGET